MFARNALISVRQFAAPRRTHGAKRPASRVLHGEMLDRCQLVRNSGSECPTGAINGDRHHIHGDANVFVRFDHLAIFIGCEIPYLIARNRLHCYPVPLCPSPAHNANGGPL